jgi:tetratricopeptide (TPR) repeat protein
MTSADARSQWNSYLQLGHLAYDRGWYAIAKKNFHRAITAIESEHCEDSPLSTALLGLGLSCCQLKEFSDAEKHFNKLLGLSHTQHDDLAFADELAEAAVLYQKMGELERSEQLLKQCLTIIKECKKCASVEEAKVLKSLALVNCKKGNFAEAEKLINKALPLIDTNAIHPSRLLAEMLGVVALIAVKKRQFSEAEETIDRAISILEMVTGGEHPELADFLQYAAEIFRDAGCPEKVDPLIVRAKLIRTTVRAKDR